MARVLLGVTGGIAAYKACELTRLLVRAGHDVIPLVTRGADRFVRRETFAALARRPAREDLYPHLARADLLVIAPLTANTMAKLAHGLADDVLTEAALAHRGPVLVAPAMSPRMWAHAATQANATTLRDRGVALAEEARRRGAEVTLIVSNLAVAAPEGVDVVEAPTAADVEREAAARADADVVLMAAAVSDYRPVETEDVKRPKDEKSWQIELEPTVDVLRELAQRRANGQVLVGFAAETGEGGLERAREKLAAKRVDLIVYNDVAREDTGFDSPDNEVVIVSAAGERRVGKAPKAEIAAAILDEVERLV